MEIFCTLGWLVFGSIAFDPAEIRSIGRHENSIVVRFHPSSHAIFRFYDTETAEKSHLLAHTEWQMCKEILENS